MKSLRVGMEDSTCFYEFASKGQIRLLDRYGGRRIYSELILIAGRKLRIPVNASSLIPVVEQFADWCQNAPDRQWSQEYKDSTGRSGGDCIEIFEDAVSRRLLEIEFTYENELQKRVVLMAEKAHFEGEVLGGW